MALSGNIVGDISDPRVPQTKLYFEWKIPDYFSLSQRADNYFESPPFSFLNRTWGMRIFPNGERMDNTVGLVKLCLFMQDSVLSYVAVTFTLGIQTYDAIIENERSTNYFNSIYNSFGGDVCERMHLRSLCLPAERTLTVFCEVCFSPATHRPIQMSLDAASQTSQDSVTSLCRDFEDLLTSELKSDVTFKVQDHDFRVHKLILGARSTVFAAMFEHDMAEKNDGVVKIIDCDRSIFKDFLQYIYTGKVKHLSWDNVIGLFVTADKYCVKELKEQCVEFMMEDLSLDTACDVILVADRHNMTELRESAKKFLIENIKTVVSTDKWNMLLAENSVLAIEILMKFVPGKEQSSNEEKI